MSKPDWVAKAKRIMAEGERAESKAEASLEGARRGYYSRLAEVFKAAQKANPKLSAAAMDRALGKSKQERGYVAHVLLWDKKGRKAPTPFAGTKTAAYSARHYARRAVREQPDVIVAEYAKLSPDEQTEFMDALRAAGVGQREAPPRRASGSNGSASYTRGAAEPPPAEDEAPNEPSAADKARAYREAFTGPDDFDRQQAKDNAANEREAERERRSPNGLCQTALHGILVFGGQQCLNDLAELTDKVLAAADREHVQKLVSAIGDFTVALKAAQARAERHLSKPNGASHGKETKRRHLHAV